MSERTELPMREERCDTCRFSVFDEDEIYMQCRRYPPALCETIAASIVGEDANEEPGDDGITPEQSVTCADAWVWPMVNTEDWCGEWKAKDGAKASLPSAEELRERIGEHVAETQRLRGLLRIVNKGAQRSNV